VLQNLIPTQLMQISQKGISKKSQHTNIETYRYGCYKRLTTKKPAIYFSKKNVVMLSINSFSNGGEIM
jgi:hypothetical protein